MGWVLTLLVVGAVLMLLETVLPGMIAGTIGFGCLVAAVIAAYSHFGASGGNITLLFVSLLLVGGTLAWMKYLPDSMVARLFVSKQVIGGIGAERPELLHQTGTAFTDLRPCGTALINGQRIDVVTEGNLIESGTPLKVVALEGMRVVVRDTTGLELVDPNQTDEHEPTS